MKTIKKIEKMKQKELSNEKVKDIQNDARKEKSLNKNKQIRKER